MPLKGQNSKPACLVCKKKTIKTSLTFRIDWTHAALNSKSNLI